MHQQFSDPESPEMSISLNSEQLIKQWLSNLGRHVSSSLRDDPRYYLHRPQSLITTSQPQSFRSGTGEQICADLFDAFRTVQHEILFVTCFWAKCASQAAFASALRALSARAVASSRRIRVRIGFSSSSLWQKVTQTSSLSGKEWAPSSWAGTFGLPSAADLPGLDVSVRSIFVWPLSVMHSKFVIYDRERLFLPSCNVSWQEWFEGCIELRGDVVGQTLLFWEAFWGQNENILPLQPDGNSVAELEPFAEILVALDPEHSVLGSQGEEQPLQVSLTSVGTIPTILLPSPHHRNPCFRPFPFFLSCAPPPPTPLNIFLLTALSAAKRSIYIQSPNVTSQPVLDGILAALQRGVSVRIISNRRMQVVEQLLTAGQLTEWALEDLWRLYTKMGSPHRQTGYRDAEQDLELGPTQRGALDIWYYQCPSGREDQSGSSRMQPVKSHLKLTVIDEEIVVLGSGNMDRASWYTSQELGMAFFSREMAIEIVRAVWEELEGCLERAH